MKTTSPKEWKNGGHVHYIIESKVQWKPFGLVTPKYPQNGWLARWQFLVHCDVCAPPPPPPSRLCIENALECTAVCRWRLGPSLSRGRVQIKSVKTRKLPQQTVSWHKTNHQAGRHNKIKQSASVLGAFNLQCRGESFNTDSTHIQPGFLARNSQEGDLFFKERANFKCKNVSPLQHKASARFWRTGPLGGGGGGINLAPPHVD